MDEETSTNDAEDRCLDDEALLNLFCPRDHALAKEILGRANRQKARPHRKRLPKESHEDWVPLRKIFKTANVPEAVAGVIEQALNLMKLNGDIDDTNLWQGLEYVFAEFLSGPRGHSAGHQPMQSTSP